MTVSRLSDLHLEGADLRDAKLQNANLGWVRLELANLMRADLQAAALSFAHPEYADLGETNLKFAHLDLAYLNNAFFDAANLESANLSAANCESASFGNARLVMADLGGANLEDADLEGAQRAGANLIEARFSAGTKLKDVVLSEREHGNAFLVDVRWGEANLSVIDWETLKSPGQESLVDTTQHPLPFDNTAEGRLARLKAAVRTNRQLATALRSQGLNEEADCFAYRAQLFQRKVLLRQHKFGRALGSKVLDLISGYGYKPIRSFITGGRRESPVIHGGDESPPAR